MSYEIFSQLTKIKAGFYSYQDEHGFTWLIQKQDDGKWGLDSMGFPFDLPLARYTTLKGAVSQLETILSLVWVSTTNHFAHIFIVADTLVESLTGEIYQLKQFKIFHYKESDRVFLVVNADNGKPDFLIHYYDMLRVA